MLGLAAIRSSLRCTPAIVKWASSRSVRTGNKFTKRNAATRVESSSSNSTQATGDEILSDLKRLVGDFKSTDEAYLQELARSVETEHSDVSLPESTETEDAYLRLQESQAALGLKYDPSTLPLLREFTARDDKVSEEEYAMTLVHGRSVFPPHLHPRTHDIPVANIHFRSHHIPLLKLFTHFALHAASSLGIPASNVIHLPTQRSLWTVIRSPFAHKKSQENFERRVHKRAIKAWDADPEVVRHWISYLRKNAMPGVGMKVTVWDRVPLGIGASDLDGLDTMENLMVEAPSGIKALGQQIVAEEASKQLV